MQQIQAAYVSQTSLLIDDTFMRVRFDEHKAMPQLIKTLFNSAMYTHHDEIYQKVNASKKPTNLDIIKYECLLGSVYKLNSDCQAVILGFSFSFSSMITLQKYCSDLAIRNFAKIALSQLNINFYFYQNPNSILLKHIFICFEHSCNLSEKEKFLTLYRKQQCILEQAKTKMQIGVEKITHLFAFTVKVLAIPISLYLAYKAYRMSENCVSEIQSTYIPMGVNKIVNYAPTSVIRTGALLYDNRLYLFLLSVISRTMGFDQHKLINLPLRACMEIAYLPQTIMQFLGSLSWNIAKKAFNYSLPLMYETANYANVKVEAASEYRLNQERLAAQQLFVKSLANSRSA